MYNKFTFEVNYREKVGRLDISYKSNTLKRICTRYDAAKRAYGDKMAEKIAQRINEISSADSVDLLVQFSVGRCHPLKGDRNGQFAMDLVHPYRLLFEKDRGIITLVKIISIEDYH